MNEWQKGEETAIGVGKILGLSRVLTVSFLNEDIVFCFLNSTNGQLPKA